MLIRLLDFFFSFFGLLILSPLLLILFIIGLFDTGSPIFSQERVGKNLKPFCLKKFRTMSKDTISVASHLSDYNQITKFGSFLRKFKLDELLQLVNVLKGEMSLVGPRPNLFNQTELINIRKKYDVYDIKPGITGLSQVSGIDMSTPEKLAISDSNMIKKYNITKYFYYIIITVLGKGQGDRIKKK